MPRQVVRRRKKTVMQRYAHFLAHHPFLILTVTFCVNIVLLVAIVCTDSLPTFDDPQAGFEPRGTLINQRATAWRSFLGRDDVQTPQQDSGNGNALVRREVDRDGRDGDYDTIKGPQTSPVEEKTHSTGQMTSLGPITESAGFFCSDPVPGHGRIILQRKDSGNLLELPSIREICLIGRAIRHLPEFRQLAEQSTDGQLCRSYSLPNYLVALVNKSSCHQLTLADLEKIQNLTSQCLPAFQQGHLTDDCRDGACSRVPAVCVRDSLIYHLLYYLSDKESRKSSYRSMKYTLVLLPVWSSPAALPLYRAIRRLNVSRDWSVEVMGMEMGLGDRLFEMVLLEDTYLMGMAAGVVVVVLWIYTASLFVTLMNMLAIFFSLVVSYFLYVFVLRLTFFPFMNLLTCIIVVAIGADALVIYARIWHLAKTEKNDGRFEKVVHATFRHAAQAILVSSLTASAALFSDMVNPIIAIRCFSIFAGLTVLVHFLFAVTWMPACFIIADKWSSSLYVCRFLSATVCDAKSPLCRLLYPPVCRLQSGIHQFCDFFRIFFEKLLPCVVIRLKWMWVSVFCLLTVGSCVVVLVYPALQLAAGQHFALWNRAHPGEQFHLLKEEFVFEERPSRSEHAKMSLRFVWGVLALNQASRLDPAVTGPLVMDGQFDLADSRSQVWMMQFCQDVKQQDFFDNTTLSDPFGNFCYLEVFKGWMDQECVGTNAVCCTVSTFPYSSAVFTQCTIRFLQTISRHHHPTVTNNFGPNFNSLNQIDAFVLHVPTSQPYSHSLAVSQAFHSRVEQWFNSALLSAPPGLARGWLTGDFDFLDLQQSLISGTAMALVVSLSVALLVLFFTTLNVGVSVIATFVIAGIMLATTASLVLMGWQLNVFESTIICLAIGLSVDFTLHYAVAYCCAESYDERELKTNVIISEMASSVTMSALTTFLAGVLVIPSEILFYRQIGLFILVVISISLFYATILFPSCLAVVGPQAGFLQFHYPSCRPFCCPTDPSKLVEKSMHSSTEFDTTITTGTFDRDRGGDKHFNQVTTQPYQHTSLLPGKSTVTGDVVVVTTATPEQAPKNALFGRDPRLAEEETDSLGELGSVPASRGPSRGPSLIRRQTAAATGGGRGMFPWDYIMQKLPLTRHFSVAGSSVIYIDSDVRSVTSDVNGDIPAVLPNIREDVPEVWVRRTE